MTPQTQTSAPIDDVYAAEAELDTLEDALASEVNRLKSLRREATEHLTRAKSQAEDPGLVSELGKVEVPSVTVKAQTDEARMARLKAVAVRKACLEKAQSALAAHEKELDHVFDYVRDQEQAAKQRAVQKSAAAEAARSAAARKKAEAPVEEDSLEAQMLRAVETHQAKTVEEMPAVAPAPAPAPAAAPVAAAKTVNQRRAAQRASLCAEISLGSDSNFFTGFTNDVSEGGVFVATVNLLPLGTQIDLSFSLPNGPKIEGKGEVRWVREFDDKNPDVFPGMGIRFTDIPLPSVGAINAFAQHREPMFFPET